MLYVFLALLSLIPISEGIYILWHFKNYEKIKEKRKKTIEKPYINNYVYARMRNSLEDELGLYKCFKDYYEEESNIRFP